MNPAWTHRIVILVEAKKEDGTWPEHVNGCSLVTSPFERHQAENIYDTLARVMHSISSAMCWGRKV